MSAAARAQSEGASTAPSETSPRIQSEGASTAPSETSPRIAPAKPALEKGR
jgi:hypothetical protein